MSQETINIVSEETSVFTLEEETTIVKPSEELPELPRTRPAIKIEDARQATGCATLDEWLQRHKDQMAVSRKTRWVSEVSIAAQVVSNRWMVCCECGECALADRGWQHALCFGCGAIHLNVAFPADADVIETTLNQEPRLDLRLWPPPVKDPAPPVVEDPALPTVEEPVNVVSDLTLEEGGTQ